MCGVCMRVGMLQVRGCEVCGVLVPQRGAGWRQPLVVSVLQRLPTCLQSPVGQHPPQHPHHPPQEVRPLPQILPLPATVSPSRSSLLSLPLHLFVSSMQPLLTHLPSLLLSLLPISPALFQSLLSRSLLIPHLSSLPSFPLSPSPKLCYSPSLPPSLPLSLHRFVYHGTTGSKVDAPVSFPLELDPRLVSHDCHMTDPLELAACVCHFGCKSITNLHIYIYIYTCTDQKQLRDAS